jgi:hypothetical protein
MVLLSMIYDIYNTKRESAWNADPLLNGAVKDLKGLTLGKLETCAGTFLAVLFALFFPWIASDETGFFEG